MTTCHQFIYSHFRTRIACCSKNHFSLVYIFNFPCRHRFKFFVHLILVESNPAEFVTMDFFITYMSYIFLVYHALSFAGVAQATGTETFAEESEFSYVTAAHEFVNRMKYKFGVGLTKEQSEARAKVMHQTKLNASYKQYADTHKGRTGERGVEENFDEHFLFLIKIRIKFSSKS